MKDNENKNIFWKLIEGCATRMGFDFTGHSGAITDGIVENLTDKEPYGLAKLFITNYCDQNK